MNAHIIYNDDELKSSRSFVPKNLNPTKQYLKHFSNSLYLLFILEHSSDRIEKYQASKELHIADNKMNYWKDRFGFNMEEAIRGCDALKKQWRTK